MTKTRIETFLSQTQLTDESLVKESFQTKTDSVFLCNHCDMSFKKRSKLNRHKREIHLKSYKKYHCEGCDQHFKRKEHFIRHLKGKHQNDKFLCPLCPVTFVERSRIRSHLVHDHDLVLCQGCSFYIEKKNLETHLCDGLSAERTPDETLGNMMDCQSCKLCFLTLKDKEEHQCTKTWMRIFLDSKITEMVQNSSKKALNKTGPPDTLSINIGKTQSLNPKTSINSDLALLKSTKRIKKVKKNKSKCTKDTISKNKKVIRLQKTLENIKLSEGTSSLNSEGSTHDSSKAESILSEEAHIQRSDSKIFEKALEGYDEDNYNFSLLNKERQTLPSSENISDCSLFPIECSLDLNELNNPKIINENTMDEMDKEEPGKLLSFKEQLCRFDFETISVLDEDLEIPQFNMEASDIFYNY